MALNRRPGALLRLSKTLKALGYARKFKGLQAYFGRATRLDYRKTFTEAFPEIASAVTVHHAVPQSVLTKYPGVMDEFELHSLENLRGIPNDLNSELHLSEIAKRWNRFFEENPTRVTNQQLLDFATKIDDEFGHLFFPPWR